MNEPKPLTHGECVRPFLWGFVFMILVTASFIFVDTFCDIEITPVAENEGVASVHCLPGDCGPYAVEQELDGSCTCMVPIYDFKAVRADLQLHYEFIRRHEVSLLPLFYEFTTERVDQIREQLGLEPEGG